MFKQIHLEDSLITLTRKNQTYRLILQSTQIHNLPVMGLEMPVNILIKIIGEMKRLLKKDNNLRPVEWEINNYKYTANFVWPSEKSERVWLSYISLDVNNHEQDYITALTFKQLQTYINFLQDINE